MTRLWDKGKSLDDLILRFTVGGDHELDERLVSYDVRASCAHARMLMEKGYLSEEVCGRIVGALEEIGRRHAAGEWRISLAEEDVHTALENRLVAAIGEDGGRLHLGRSRNDQVLAALRLYLLDVVHDLRRLGGKVIASLEDISAGQGDVPLPGYTHLQRAMPSSVRLWAEGFSAEIRDDLEGLTAVRRRISRNPLGSAAGYGVPVLDLDREATARSLGFEAVHEPVTAVQLSRGKAEAALLFEIVLLLQDLGRLAADVVLFATAEFGFLVLDEGLTTGSSIMPQKRNPDVFELVRGRAARSVSLLDAVLLVTTRLPSGYHRDLQLLKGPLFQGIDEAEDVLEVMAHALRGLRFDPLRCAAAMDEGLLATEKAMKLVLQEGIPFRSAYRRVAGVPARPKGE